MGGSFCLPPLLIFHASGALIRYKKGRKSSRNPFISLYSFFCSEQSNLERLLQKRVQTGKVRQKSDLSRLDEL
jgi:hypothetical protein